MEFGFCELSLAPVRLQPDDKSEMATQLLFGDLIVVLEKQDKWVRIRAIDDNYEGWIDQKQYLPISEEEFVATRNADAGYVKDLVEVVACKKRNQVIPVVMGSVLRGKKGHIFCMAGREYEFSGNLAAGNEAPDRSALIENALVYLNAPYFWGGKSPFGIDCSGFTQMVYRLSGIKLLRDAYQQASMGETVNLIHEAGPGDLLFFNNAEGQIVHCGIYLGNDKVIHASGKVRVDPVDHQGIYNPDKKGYTHSLRLIKKIL
ncbi:MAG: C40 family peptidase [Bacteroidales bacterium]|nr:C40 family peptidase [Bacteroidales bacterium]